MPITKAYFTKYFFSPIALLIAIIYLVSCFTQFINPSFGSVFTLLSLGYIVLFILMLLIVLCSAFIEYRFFIVSLIVLLVGWSNFSTTFSFKLNSRTLDSNLSTIKVLSWNVNNFSSLVGSEKRDTGVKFAMYRFIKETNADILCIQDNAFAIDEKEKFNEVKELEKLGFKYHVLSNDFRPVNSIRQYGTGIFSKYPIAGFQKVNYKGHYYESLLYANVIVNKEILRVFTTHLRSMVLHDANFYPEEDYTMVQDDTAAIFDKSLIRKLSYFDIKHAEQANTAKQVMDTTRIPYIFCADLNSVPSSYVYHHLAKGLKDVFLEKGFGIGQSYCGLTRTLRIDVILSTPNIKTLSYECPKLPLSDHYPIVTTLQLP